MPAATALDLTLPQTPTEAANDRPRPAAVPSPTLDDWEAQREGLDKEAAAAFEQSGRLSRGSHEWHRVRNGIIEKTLAVGLVQRIVRGICREVEDLLQDQQADRADASQSGALAVVEAWSTYEPGRGKWCAWASLKIRDAVRRELQFLASNVSRPPLRFLRDEKLAEHLSHLQSLGLAFEDDFREGESGEPDTPPTDVPMAVLEPLQVLEQREGVEKLLEKARRLELSPGQRRALDLFLGLDRLVPGSTPTPRDFAEVVAEHGRHPSVVQRLLLRALGELRRGEFGWSGDWDLRPAARSATRCFEFWDPTPEALELDEATAEVLRATTRAGLEGSL